MALLEKFAVTVKFFNYERGFGFFSVPALSDAFVHISTLEKFGFDAGDMQVDASAVIDLECDAVGKNTCGGIHSIGTKTATQEAPAPTVADVSNIKVGDVVQAAFTFGFKDGKKTHNYGFCRIVGSDRDVFVHWSNVHESISFDDFKKGVVFDVLIMDQNEKGLAGSVNGIHVEEMSHAERAKVRDQLDAEKAARDAEKLAKKKAREERRAEIMGRVTYEVQSGGKKLFGIPATEEEWPMLAEGTKVVLVSSFSAADGVGDVLQAFQVCKKGGKPTKLSVHNDVKKFERRVARQFEQSFVGVFADRDGVNHTAPCFVLDRVSEVDDLIVYLNDEKLQIAAVQVGDKAVIVKYRPKLDKYVKVDVESFQELDISA